MRTFRRSDVVDDVPIWSLWVVALVCFAPVTALWLLGVLVAPFWVSMIAVLLTNPERFAADSAEALWGSIAALTYVVAGFVGLLGLLRVLTLPRRERPRRHRFFTIGMVAVGLAALLGFSYPIGVADLADGRDLVGLIVIVALPFIGAAWLLVKSWRFLLAGPAHSDADSRMPRT
jgi:hypothetical protein